LISWLRFPVRVAAYLWASPNTCIGIAAGLILGGRFRIVDGVVEIHGQRVAKLLNRFWVPAAAITLGHAVLGQSNRWLLRTRSHERVHVRQYERWGPFFIPAYLTVSLILYARGRDGYSSNPFEIQAYRESENL
jgi:hypothetical protein